MAAISALSLDMEGTDGATANAGNIGVTAFAAVGSTATFSAAHPKQGSTALSLVGTSGTAAAMSSTITGVTTFWDVFYLWVNAAPGAVLTLAQWFGDSGANQGGSLRLNTDLTLQMRDALTNVGLPIGPIPTGQWIRVAVKAIPGSATGHRCKVYVASNGDTATATYDTGDLTATHGSNSNIDTWKFGLLTNGANTIFIDRNRADNATEPAGLAAAGPPVITKPADLVKELGGSSFTLTGSATAQGGNTIASVAWSILSGTAVTLSGQSTNTVTITPPAAGSSTVMRYTATDSAGQPTTGDVTVTWVTVGQIFRPVGDVAANSWTAFPTSTPISNAIDETVLSLADYVQSPNGATGQEYKMRLESKPAPGSTSNVFIELVMDITADVTTQSTVVKLYDSDGTTVRKTFTAITDLTTTPTARDFTLSGSEAGAITGWASGLVIGVAATVS